MVNWKEAIRKTPVLGRVSYAFWPSKGQSAPTPMFETSSQYWEARYKLGGNSGAGSYNRLAEFKAEILNDFVARHKIATIIEFGCGDGAQLELAEYKSYIGVDVSHTVLYQVRRRFANERHIKFIHTSEIATQEPADLTLSLDVIYHLVEDSTFDAYMHDLFRLSLRFVIVYASNEDKAWVSPHVRHRRFTDWVEQYAPQFQLSEHIPNLYPYDEADINNTSFADFFIFEQR